VTRLISTALSCTLGLVASLGLFGCPASKGDANAKPDAGSALLSAASSAPVDALVPTPQAKEASALPGDASGALAFAWKVTNATNPRVNASAVAADQTLLLGSLDATADGPPSGNVEACSTKNSGPTSSTLHCGGTPAYNYLTANLTGGALVITRTSGVDDVPGSETVVELARRPTTAKSLRATGPASPLLAGNCRPGHVQRTAESPCLRQCLKGTECKAPDVCTMISVTGGDGPHKVHACVPPGK